MIHISELHKSFGTLTAVDGISFSASSGQIYGLLGPNGAGKSTTINCLSGLLKPSSGHLSLLGHDVVGEPRRAKAQLGIVPQELAFYQDLSARENLRFFGAAYGLRGLQLESRVDAVLADIGLADRAAEPCKQFSGGMQRRLNFGCALVHEPQILLLDEPTVGVDPQSRQHLMDMVRDLATAGACVLYTTHYMEEAEQLCHRLGIIDHGKLIAEGTLDELRGRMGESDILRLTGTFANLDLARDLPEDITVLATDHTQLQLSLPQANRRLPEIFQVIQARGDRITETTLSRPSLASLFMHLTGKDLRE